MKCGFKDFWIDLDIKNAYQRLQEKVCSLFQQYKDHYYRKKIKIAFIDDRYLQTKYICSYGILYITQNQLENLFKTNRHWEVGCKDFLTNEEYQKYVQYDSGELNGYELETPELNEFDIVIKDE